MAAKSFDVFVSHNSGDKAEVRKLIAELECYGLRAWLDERQLPPGRRWGPILEDIIQDVRATLVVISSSGIGPWQSLEMYACLSQAVVRGMPVIPLLLKTQGKGAETDRVDVPLFLRQFGWIELTDIAEHNQIERVVEAVTGGRKLERSAKSKQLAKPTPQVLVIFSERDAAVRQRLARFFKDLAIEPKPRLQWWNERRIAERKKFVRALDQAAVVVGLLSPNYQTAFGDADLLEPLADSGRREGLVKLGLAIDPDVDPGQPPVWTGGPILPRSISDEGVSPLAAGFTEFGKELTRMMEDWGYSPSPYPDIAERQRIGTESLPRTGLELFGRQTEVQALDDCWNQHKRIAVVEVCGSGGTGKSALINHWLRVLAEQNYRGAEYVFGWSFYSQADSRETSQRTDPRQASSDLFISEALRFFAPRADSGSDSDRPNSELSLRGSLWDRGRDLAATISKAGGAQQPSAQQRMRFRWLPPAPQRQCLLVLDGLESLQHRRGDDKGRIRDVALEAFLTELTEHSRGRCLCVITTREPLQYKEGFDRRVKKIDLNRPLQPEEAVKLVRLAGIGGNDKELLERIDQFGGNYPLPTVLAAAYLKHRFQLQPQEPLRANHLAQLPAVVDGDSLQAHIERILRAFGKELSPTQRQLLDVLSLFKQLAEPQALAQLRTARIAGLTDRIGPKDISEDGWAELIDGLRLMRLITTKGAPDGQNGALLDLHPMVRAYFAAELQADPAKLACWREGHRVLHRYYLEAARTSRAETEAYADLPARRLVRRQKEQLELFQAVVHACLAEDYQDAWSVFWNEVRQQKRHFSGNWLGWWSLDQSTLSHFFERQWDRPVRGLSEAVRIHAMNEAGYNLRALGFLNEALQPLSQSLEEVTQLVRDETVDSESRQASPEREDLFGLSVFVPVNLSKTCLPLGRIDEAVSYANLAVEHADRYCSHHCEYLVMSRCCLGDALRCAGRFWESEAAFRTAEEIQNSCEETSGRTLSDTDNYRFCELLLDEAEMVAQGWVQRSERSLTPWQDTEADPVVHRLREVRERTRRLKNTLAGSDHRSLHACVFNLTMGRSYLIEAEYRYRQLRQRKGGTDSASGSQKHGAGRAAPELLKKADSELKAAIDLLRDEAHQTYLLRGLLMRASAYRLHTLIGAPTARLFRQANTMLEEVSDIAVRGDMRMFEAEYHLELARLQWAWNQQTDEPGHRKKALFNLADAEALIKEFGYCRREPEVIALQQTIREAG